MKIVIKKGGLLWWKKFHFTLVADNGEPIGRSRKFATIDDVFVALDTLKAEYGTTVDIVRNGEIDEPYHFRLLAEDEKILLWSENYHNRRDCNDTADLIKKQIKDAKVILP